MQPLTPREQRISEDRCTCDGVSALANRCGICGKLTTRTSPLDNFQGVPPGTDITTSYEWRFRDPGFIALWERWWKAREAWGTARLSVPFDQAGPDMLYNPAPALIKDPKHAALAQEFLDARRAYLDDVKRRSDPS